MATTTVADVRRAASNAKRQGWAINASMLRNSGAVAVWLREIMLLEAAIRRYYQEQRGGEVK